METEIIIPGIAQPDIDKFDKKFKKLFFKTLLPKFTIIEKRIRIVDVQNIKIKVLKFNFKISRLFKYSGNLNDQ